MYAYQLQKNLAVKEIRLPEIKVVPEVQQPLIKEAVPGHMLRRWRRRYKNRLRAAYVPAARIIRVGGWL